MAAAKRPLLLLFAALLGSLVFLVAVPSAWLLLASASSGLPFGITGFTLDNFASTFASGTFVVEFLNTVAYAAGSTVLSLIMGIALAVIVTKTRTPMRTALRVLILVPLLTPGILYSIAWIFLAAPHIGIINSVFGLAGLSNPFDVTTLIGLIWVGGLVSTPLVTILISSALSNLDSILEEAAGIAGASKLRMVTTVTLPIIKPAILSAAMLTFLFQLGNFEIPAFIGLAGGVRVLSTSIVQLMRASPPDYGQATATAVILLAMTSALVVLYQFLTRRESLFVTVTGKPRVPTPMEIGRWRFLTLAFALGFVLIGSVLPFAVLVLASLSNSWAIVVNDPSRLLSQLSMENFRGIAALPQVGRGFADSITIALAAGTILVLFVSLLSFVNTRSRLRGRTVADLLAFMPLAFPGTVLGLGLLWTYSFLPIDLIGTLAILVLAAMTRFLPQGYQMVRSAYVQIHPELEEASQVAGSHPVGTFRRVVLPIMRNSVLSAWFFLFVVSLREIDTSILLYRPSTIVISVVIYSMFNDNLWGQLAAVGVITIIISIAVGYIISRLTGSSKLAGM